MGEHLITFWDDYYSGNFQSVHVKTWNVFKGKVWDRDALLFLLTTSHKSKLKLPIRFLHDNYSWAGRYDIFQDKMYSDVKKEFISSYQSTFYSDLSLNGDWSYIFENLEWQRPYPKQTSISLAAKGKDLSYYKDQAQKYEDSFGTYELERFNNSLEICANPHPHHSAESTKRYVAHDFITFLLLRSYRLTLEDYIKKNKIDEISGKWVSEFKLYLKLKSHFQNDAVLYQASPNFLKGQRFDVWIPSRLVAVEYNGVQHYNPVEIFGGVEGFKQTILRDAAKREKCKNAGINLIEVREGYDFDNLISKIYDCTK
jgi:hypothetical protein